MIDLNEYGTNPTNDFEKYLPMFFEGKHNEAFGSWNDSESWKMIYK